MNRFFVNVFILFMVFLACKGKKETIDTKTEENTPILQKFSLQLYNSEDMLESKDLEEIVIFSFVSDFCGPCIKELESIKSLQDTYTKQEIEYIIAIIGEGESYSHKIDSIGIEGHIVRADSIFLGNLQIGSVPTRILFSGEHQVHRLEGAPSYMEPEFRNKIDDLLGIEHSDSSSNSSDTSVSN